MEPSMRMPAGSVWTAQDLLFDSNITPTDLKVFLGLCAHASAKTDSTYVSQDTLAERLHLSKRSVAGSLKNLQDNHYIKWETRRRVKGRGRTTNMYYIVNNFESSEKVVASVEVEEVIELEPVNVEEAKEAPIAVSQTNLFNIPKPKPAPTWKTMREGTERALIKVEALLVGEIKESELTTLDVCFYYQHLHKEIVGYSVSVNKTTGQAQGRKSSVDYMEAFLDTYNLTPTEAIHILPKVLSEFKSTCELMKRKKADWALHIGLLTWTGATADIETIMSRIKPKVNDKYDNGTAKPLPESAYHSSGIVF